MDNGSHALMMPILPKIWLDKINKYSSVNVTTESYNLSNKKINEKNIKVSLIFFLVYSSYIVLKNIKMIDIFFVYLFISCRDQNLIIRL